MNCFFAGEEYRRMSGNQTPPVKIRDTIRIKGFVYRAVLPVLLLFLTFCGAEAPDSNVIVITLDTTRTDHIDTGDGAKAYTPELKRFAQQAVTFQQAYSTIPQTLPAHLSMFTSRLPHECGVLGNPDIYDGRFTTLAEVLKKKGYYTAGMVSLGTLAAKTGISRGFDLFQDSPDRGETFFLPAETMTNKAIKLIQQLKDRKFFLFLHYSDPHSPYSPPGVEAPFRVFLDGQLLFSFNAYQGAILRKTIPLERGLHTLTFKVETTSQDFDQFALRRLKTGKNCTLTFENITFSKDHYNGTHLMQGTTGAIHIRCKGNDTLTLFQVIPMLTRNGALEMYRKEVEYMDRYIGKFLRVIEQEGLAQRTAIVIVGDHGEGLGERNKYFGHVRYLNRQFIHVPYMIYWPGIMPQQVKQPVSLLSVSPTLLEYLGIDNRLHGFRAKESVVTAIKTGTWPSRPIYSFAFSPSALKNKLSIISWPYQSIFFLESTGVAPRIEFYNLLLCQSYRQMDRLAVDVLMRYSMPDFHFFHNAYTRLKNVFAMLPKTIKKDGQSVLDEDKREKLRSLGYVE